MNKITLEDGIYKSENHDNAFDGYDILLKVKETEKSFNLALIYFKTKYGATQIEDMFRNSKKVVIKKDGSKHVMRIWDNKNFTLYPYRIGVPFVFDMIE